MAKLSKLWVEKYRPEKIEDIIFTNDTTKKEFQIMVQNGEFRNLLLAGIQGTGKTTISHALINECNVHELDVLYLNAADEKMEAIRDKVNVFSQTSPLGKFKVVQLEEMDKLPKVTQTALLKIIEDSSDNCRFICTCNFPEKILPSLKSRLEEYKFKFPNREDVFIYGATILDKEGIDVDIDAFEKIVDIAYPDIRKLVIMLQQFSQSGKLEFKPTFDDGVSATKSNIIDLLIADKFSDLAKVLVDETERDEYEEVYEFLYRNIQRSKKFSSTENRKRAVVLIADHLYKHSLVAHPHINLEALIINLESC